MSKKQKSGSKKEIILASSSPRRKRLLGLLDLKFRVKKAEVEEKINSQKVEEEVLRIALEKALAARKGEKNALVIAADTVIVYQDKIIGKPKSLKEAIQILKKLRGKTHQVVTGIVVLDVDSDSVEERFVETELDFLDLPDREIKEYVERYKPLDKAGAYAIQEGALFWVGEIRGSISNVLGLPLEELREILKRFGFKL